MHIIAFHFYLLFEKENKWVEYYANFYAENTHFYFILYQMVHSAEEARISSRLDVSHTNMCVCKIK